MFAAGSSRIYGCILLLAGVLPGCAGLHDAARSGNMAWLTGKSETPPETAPREESAPGPTYTVEIRREGRKPEAAKFEHRQGMFLQDAVVQSGAAAKFPQMTLYIMRTPPQGGPAQRMTSVYDSAEKRVAWESDYAIYPGDHVVITEDTTSRFDEVVNRFLGPFARYAARRRQREIGNFRRYGRLPTASVSDTPPEHVCPTSAARPHSKISWLPWFSRRSEWLPSAHHFTTTGAPSRTPSIMRALSPTMASSRFPPGPIKAMYVMGGCW